MPVYGPRWYVAYDASYTTYWGGEMAGTAIQRVTTPAGDPAWLVTNYDDVKTLLTDSRLGRSHAEPERAARVSQSAILGGPEGHPSTEPLVLCQVDHAHAAAADHRQDPEPGDAAPDPRVVGFLRSSRVGRDWRFA